MGEKYHWGTHDVKITILSIESNSKNARFSEMPWFNAQFACDGKEVTKSSVDCIKRILSYPWIRVNWSFTFWLSGFEAF